MAENKTGDPRRMLRNNSDAWVEFRKDGYPFSLRKQLNGAKQDDEMFKVILPYIVACHIPTVSGNLVESISEPDAIDDIDEILVSDLIIEFYKFRSERSFSPISPNS